jgi:hypothetical protein
MLVKTTIADLVISDGLNDGWVILTSNANNNNGINRKPNTALGCGLRGGGTMEGTSHSINPQLTESTEPQMYSQPSGVLRIKSLIKRETDLRA